MKKIKLREHVEKHLNLKILNEDKAIVRYARGWSCVACKDPSPVFYFFKPGRKFVCSKCGKNPFPTTEHKWKES